MGRARSRTRAFSKTTTLPASSALLTLGRFATRELDLRTGYARRPAAEEDHGRCSLAPHCQEGPKVGVGRDDDAAVPGGPLEDDDVVGFPESVVADMDRVVSSISQAGRHEG